MKVIICENYNEISERAAQMVASQVKSKPDCILGLATGSTPIGMYSILCDMYKNGELDFSRVTTFNLDEYYPMTPDNSQSYHYFMNEHLFSKINVPAENIHIPDGNSKDIETECKQYDESVAAAGGVDIQILGIGENGHIGFNEPDEMLVVGTHKTGLTENTISANSRFFESMDEVPKEAVTMGMGTIMSARSIILMASGKNKHNAIAFLMKNVISTSNPASMLHLHGDVTLICDKLAYYGE